eukprot:Pompholyxophrys_punicea_v1_NODE_143_length_3211_cov_4.433777.p2 type:complete len:263 gc:universal NODE_143_length_3211_cov_4.433777:816-1604(+)
MICLSQLSHLPLNQLQSMIRVTPKMYAEALKMSLELLHNVRKVKRESAHRYNDQIVLNCISFLLSSENIQHVAHGCKTVKLSNGEKVTLPKLQRKVIRTRLWERYQGSFLSAESRVGRTVFYRICNILTSVDQSVLAGLDNLAEELGRENTKTFVDRLSEALLRVGLPHIRDPIKAADELQKKIDSYVERVQQVYSFIKSEYQYHIQLSSECATHCIQFALSQPNRQLRSPCAHSHSFSCEKCNQVWFLLSDIKSFMEANVS